MVSTLLLVIKRGTPRVSYTRISSTRYTIIIVIITICTIQIFMDKRSTTHSITLTIAAAERFPHIRRKNSNYLYEFFRRRRRRVASSPPRASIFRFIASRRGKKKKKKKGRIFRGAVDRFGR